MVCTSYLSGCATRISRVASQAFLGDNLAHDLPGRGGGWRRVLYVLNGAARRISTEVQKTGKSAEVLCFYPATQSGGGGTMPWAMAQSATWWRECRASFSRMWWTWVPAVA